MVVPDLRNACSDWSTVKKCRPAIRRDVVTHVADVCRRHVGKCGQTASRAEQLSKSWTDLDEIFCERSQFNF